MVKKQKENLTDFIISYQYDESASDYIQTVNQLFDFKLELEEVKQDVAQEDVINTSDFTTLFIVRTSTSIEIKMKLNPVKSKFYSKTLKTTPNSLGGRILQLSNVCYTISGGADKPQRFTIVDYSKDTPIKQITELQTLLPRYYHGVAYDFDHQIYIISGQAGLGQNYNKRCEKFNVFSQTFTEVASIPIGCKQFGCNILHGKIYVIGGNLGGQDVSSIQMYNIANDSWSKHQNPINEVKWVQCINLQKHSALLVICNTVNYNRMKTLIFDGQAIKENGQYFPGSFTSVQSIEIGGKVYCFDELNKLYSYDISKGTWTNIKEVDIL